MLSELFCWEKCTWPSVRFWFFSLCSQALVTLAEVPIAPWSPWEELGGDGSGQDPALLDLALAALSQGERFHAVLTEQGEESRKKKK